MQYTSRQRQAVFMKARMTHVLKNYQQLDLYLKDWPEIKRKVEDYHRRHPYDDGMQWFDSGFMVQTKEDYRRAEDLLEQRLQIASDYAGYSIYDLDQKGIKTNGNDIICSRNLNSCYFSISRASKIYS